MRSSRLGAAAAVLALVGCSSGGNNNSSGGVVKAPPQTAYDLANDCFVLKADGRYVNSTDTGFATAAADASGAEHFYMKPTGLGRYLFYTKAAKILTADEAGATITSEAAPLNGADWTFSAIEPGAYTAKVGEKALGLDGEGTLVQAATPAVLMFERATGCTDYPEMPTGIAAETFKTALAAPVIGFAEVHAHMGMGSEMSDGAPENHAGPSAGGVMYGQAMNRFGVVEALKDCSGVHGQDGETSPEWAVLDGGDAEHAEHETKGWPTFKDWPKNDSQLHQQIYWRWVERAWKAGLRTMVVLGTNIEALCNVAQQTGGNKDENVADEECRDMEVGLGQVNYLYAIEKYIDAQAGGPGKGFYRIVKTPEEARAVIAEGKLAVIPGLEFSNLFHCSVTFGPGDNQKDPNEAGTSACTKEQIDAEIELAWNKGVRAVFPYHDVDSALGGTGIFDSAALNLVGFYGTNGYWRTYDCEDGGEGEKFFYNAGDFMYNKDAPAGWGDDPVTAGIIAAFQGQAPTYPTGRRQCNARTVTPLGYYALDKIMKKGFTIDIDHAEIKSKQIMLDLGAKTTPYYPMISAHGGHGGINNEQIKQIVKQGGIVYPSLPNGKDFVDFANKLKPLWDAGNAQRVEAGLPARPLAIGYGSDADGLRNLPDPRGLDREQIKYPFTLFQGEGWGPQFAAAGIAPIKVEQLSIPYLDADGKTPGRTWDMNAEGMAHYGLVPDIVEEIRIEGGAPVTDAVYNSAEAYLQLWEQTLAASASAKTLPTPE
jgi:hypothetical protein